MTRTVSLEAHPLAWTHLDADLAEKLTGWTTDAHGGQALAEVAGRACYESYDRPHPATATNAGYLANILRLQHESVLEHATVTFYVRGVSRSLLLELERHRFVSLSVLSQRYVDESDAAVVVPPAEKADPVVRRRLIGVHEEALRAYQDVVARLVAAGLPRKQAREAARAVLPNATETRFIVTANLRGWRDVLRRRWHVAADAEIRAFAGTVLGHLRALAPNAVQDIPVEPYGVTNA